MARSRIIKHDFWTSEDIIELEIVDRLFFIGFWNFADDSGILPDKPKTLKCMIFPADDIDCSLVVDRLVTCGLLVRYMWGTNSYLKVDSWDSHQVIKYPTFKYPLEDGTIPTSAQRKRTKKKDIDTGLGLGLGIGIGVEEVSPTPVEDMSGTCGEPQDAQNPKQMSEHLQNLIFSSFGGPLTTNVSEWLSNHSEKWIIEAIARAEATGKCKASYVNAILKGWQSEGYPRDDNRRPGAIGSGGVQQGEDSGGKFDHIGTTIHVPDVRADSMQNGQGLPENSGDRF